MEYYQLHNKLKEAFDTNNNVALPDLGVRITHNNLAFISQSARTQDDLDWVDYEVECNL